LGKTYALPETQSFNMMFVRTDIFGELGLTVPKTWDEMELLIPELQKRNMSIGLGHGLGELAMFMFQQGEPLYLNEGESANLDSSVAVRSFTKLCEYYTLYGFPTDYDAANRFRSGEIPLMITDYGLYNQLSLFAPEIRGDWQMFQIPGTPDENGIINNAQAAIGFQDTIRNKCMS
jgi:ABC-type glycerol-3-phosphate transport system substrate-binding protein